MTISVMRHPAQGLRKSSTLDSLRDWLQQCCSEIYEVRSQGRTEYNIKSIILLLFI